MTIHGSHWGAFRPRVEGGRLVEAVPFEGDTDPSPLLRSVPGAVHARNRVTRPAVRGSWLDGTGGRRGADPFVEVSWETALDLVAGELRRVHAEHGPEAVWVAVTHGDIIKSVLADALGMHLDSFQRILVDPASISIIRYTDTRPYVVTANSTNADLGKLLAPPPKRARKRASDSDAAVGGGLGAADATA